MTVHTLKLYTAVYGNCTVFVKKVGTSTYQTDRRADGEIGDEVYRIALIEANNAVGAINDYVTELLGVSDQVNGVALTTFGKIIHYEDAEGIIRDTTIVFCYKIEHPDAVGVIGDNVSYRIITISHQVAGTIQDSVAYKTYWVRTRAGGTIQDSITYKTYWVHTDTAGVIQDSVVTDTSSGTWKKLYPNTAFWS